MNDLIESGIVPNSGNFDIDEHQLYSYTKLYELNSESKGNKKFDYVYARKLAGLSLVKLKLSRNIKTSDIKEGFVYLIRNPSWPEHTKVGMAINVKERIKVYQTYDPKRSFYISNYEFVLDRRKVEKEVLSEYKFDIELGEWIKNSQCDEIIRFIRSLQSYWPKVN